MIRSSSEGIGDRLSKYRRMAGLSAQELSDRIGGEMSRGVIANIESGRKTDLTVDQVISLAWALGIPFVSLALPVEKPYEYVAIIRGTGPKSWHSLRSQELLAWMTAKPDPFRRDRGSGDPAGVMARAILRSLFEFTQLNSEVTSLRARVEVDPHLQPTLDERTAERNDLANLLLDLGVDLSMDDTDPEGAVSSQADSLALIRSQAKVAIQQETEAIRHGFDLLLPDRLESENWTFDGEMTDEAFAEFERLIWADDRVVEAPAKRARQVPPPDAPSRRVR